MKVILNTDVKHLGEEGDVKVVANGYARNYLFPRNLALPYNEVTVSYFEGKKEEIEAKKEAKRKDSASLKDKLSAHTITISMPAGNNGKLYGAVTSQTIAEALHKDGFEVERKKIDVPGLTIKSLGKYTVNIRLYESALAELQVVVEKQEDGKQAEVHASTDHKASN
jgi:large subunit ribosomal protein L9